MPDSIPRDLPGGSSSSGGGILAKLNDHFNKHLGMWAVGLGVATILVMIMISRAKSSYTDSTASNTASSTIDPQTGYPYGSPADQAALASTYGTSTMTPNDQITSILGYEQQNNATLNSILATLGKQQTPTTTPPVNPPHIPPTVPGKWQPGLLNFNPESSGAWGQKLTIGKTTYLTGFGGSGRLWGVPYKAGMTFQQWQNTPIGSGPGQKVLLYKGS